MYAYVACACLWVYTSSSGTVKWTAHLINMTFKTREKNSMATISILESMNRVERGGKNLLCKCTQFGKATVKHFAIKSKFK